jgi:MerR family transcriptional regulator, copper efflux regulator
MVMERTLQIENTRHGQERLTIGQMALRSGINAKAIRYYESIGLLPKASRSANGYRSFSQADLNRLILLRRLRLLGVSLDRLAPLLRAASDAQCTEVQQEVLRLIAGRLAVIDEEMKELGLLREQVQDYQRHLRACAPDSAEAFQDCRDLSCLALPSETPSSEEETHDALSNAR